MFKIKYLLSILSVLFFALWSTLAYTVTEVDNIFVEKIKLTINQNIQVDEDPKFALVERYYLFNQIQKLQTDWTRIDYLIKETKKYLREKIDVEKKIQKESKSRSEQALLEQHQWSILTNENKLLDRCFAYEEMVDDWSWVYDIPPSLTIASWQIETTCNFKIYKNWLFQIISKDYGEWEMTEMKLVKELQDFGKFVNHKWSWYDNRNAKDWLSVGLSYDNINYEWIVRHGALYNGLSGYTVYGDAQPLNKNYVFGNFGQENEYKKDWLMVDVLKVIQR